MSGKYSQYLIALTVCLLMGIACGQEADQRLEGSVILRSDAVSQVIQEELKCRDCPPKCDECPFSPYYAIWTLNKYGSQRWNLNTAESVMKENGFTIVDPAADQNVHVLGRRSNPEVVVAIVCTRIAQLQTSVVIFGVSPDERAVQDYSARIRDRIESIQSLEGDMEQIPVQG